jgi:hypothetical protein
MSRQCFFVPNISKNDVPNISKNDGISAAKESKQTDKDFLKIFLCLNLQKVMGLLQPVLPQRKQTQILNKYHLLETYVSGRLR